MTTDISVSIKRLFYKILLFDIAILAVLLILSSIFSTNAKNRLAEQLADTFRAPLISGDNRQVISDMSRAVFKDFYGVSWQPRDKSLYFSLPESLGEPNAFLFQKTVVEIFFDENLSEEAGELCFFYSRWTAIPLALLSWLLLVALSIIAAYYEQRRMLREYSLSVESKINESRAAMAAQVAHDIRSPVFALDAALKNIPQLPEKQRVIVRHAINRIQDVANSLLEKNRQQSATAAAAGIVTADKLPAVYLLSALIAPVVTEKRLQYEARPEVKIWTVVSQDSYGLFSKVQPVEFRRIISNLLNNAIEAIGDKGTVNVELDQNEGSIVLTVTDTGKGIPTEILAKLGQRGETHGKAGGSGLGLYHARTTAESWGGSLTITSELGKGTTVAINLPKAETPSYFAKELKLPPGRLILVLDDDPGIHEMWRERFESLRFKKPDIEVLNFNEPDQLRAWVKGNPDKTSKAICFFDYELTGHKETGLSMAKELGLCGQTILVTSHSEEQRIVEACTALKVRMIPKSMANLVPVSIVSNPPRAVLLDDSTITQMTWEIAADEAGAELLGYTDPDKFMADLGQLPKDMPIYIDSDLGENIKGENIAADLKEKGYTNVCLATAHPPEKFAHMPWLKVRSKEAPWVNSADSATGE
jgi:signal transduction histidine kinase